MEKVPLSAEKSLFTVINVNLLLTLHELNMKQSQKQRLLSLLIRQLFKVDVSLRGI